MEKTFFAKIIYFVLISTCFISYSFSMKKSYFLPKANHHITIFSSQKVPYIEWIAKGTKKAEGRVYSPFFRKLKVDDTVVFYNKKKDYVLCKITYLNIYRNFYMMLIGEGVENMMPQTKSINIAGKIYQSFSGANRVERYGALAIGVHPISSKY